MSFILKDTLQKNTLTEKQKIHPFVSSGNIEEISGICRYGNKIHVYYTFLPLSGIEEKSILGYFTTENFIEYKVCPPIVLPDSVFDSDGVFSGSALSEEKGISLFYTGAVKKEGELYEKNIVKVFLENGDKAGKKNVLLMHNADTIRGFSDVSHPKVWCTDEGFFMILGGSFEKKGCILIFFSHDLEKWHFYKKITSAENMGALWKYPDAFLVNGTSVLNMCVQSDEKRKKFISGFCTLTENDAYGFHELDFGNNFYAPHTFTDEKRRRIMLGVIKDVEKGGKNEKTVSCLSVPRVITKRKGVIYQTPVEELFMLRESRRMVSLERGEKCDTFSGAVFEACLHFNCEEYSVFIRDNILISCENKTVTVKMTCSEGCEKKSFFVSDASNVRIFSDTFSIEIFIDGKSYTALIDDSKKGGIYVAEGSLRGEIYKLSLNY